MTELSRKILESYQVRKTTKQKDAFIALLREYFPELQIEQSKFPKCRNLIIGDVENAKLLLTAHYDTCAWLPFPNFITPKSPILALLYSLLISLVIMIPVALLVFLLNIVLSLVTDIFLIRYLMSLVCSMSCLSLMFIGPANRRNANDNTSGVITLCELLMTLNRQQRSKVAFVFFDLEEVGLLGSARFRAAHKQVTQNTPLINFDCVSDGDHMLVAATKDARETIGEALDNSFRPAKGKKILLTNSEKVFYPSDQAGFRKGVAVAAMRHKPVLGYYIGRIHTHRDTVFDRDNITLLCNSILRLLKKM